MIPEPPAMIHEWGDSMIVRLMAAISQVESGDNDNAYNARSGAKGRFQITEAFWKRYCESGVPFARAHNRKIAEVVVFRAMRSWMGQLNARYVTADFMPTVIAQWYVCGQAGRPTAFQSDEIQRILNLYRE